MHRHTRLLLTRAAKQPSPPASRAVEGRENVDEGPGDYSEPQVRVLALCRWAAARRGRCGPPDLATPTALSPALLLRPQILAEVYRDSHDPATASDEAKRGGGASAAAATGSQTVPSAEGAAKPLGRRPDGAELPLGHDEERK